MMHFDTSNRKAAARDNKWPSDWKTSVYIPIYKETRRNVEITTQLP